MDFERMGLLRMSRYVDVRIKEVNVLFSHR